MALARISLVFALPWTLALLAPLGAAAQTLSVGPTGRYLVDRQGQPAFLQADAGWSLLAQLNTDDAATYLRSRSAAGFNAVLVNLIEHEFATNAPSNAYGQPPFTGRPFATPNEAYFAHVDTILAMAQQYGITLLMAPLYLGYQCGSEGWCAEVKAATTAEMHAWGDYVGARYAYVPNIVWVLGGDTDPTVVAPKALEMVNALLAHDTMHPWSAHNQRESWASDPWPNQSWLTVNSYYSYTLEHYEWAQAGYGMTPVRPFFLMESEYENEHSVTQQQLRAAAYSTVLWGGCGDVYGNCPMWHFGSSSTWCGSVDWRGALTSPGTESMTWAQRLFTSRHWWQLVPDYANAVLTGGAGTYGQADYAVAATTSDGSSILAYLPTTRTVTIETGSLGAGPVRAWWFRPEDGAATFAGDFAAGATSFTPPAAGDWVLVVDEQSLGLPAPGQPTVPAGVGWKTSPGGLSLAIAPNPLRGTGRLSFDLTTDATVRVTLLDLQGRERMRVAEARFLAGRVELPLDTRGLAPGLYWCRVRAGGLSEQRAVVVMW
jgi:uncharacterized protein DUF4038/collagenase-like protein with putative collagen-binding domain